MVHLKHRVCRAAVRGEETHCLIMAVPSAATVEGLGTDREDKDDRTLILLGTKLGQLVKWGIESAIHRQ
jgi:hypothetical protein